VTRDVAIYYCLTEDLDGRTIADAVELLSIHERYRCDRFVRPRDRRDFAVAHALLRRALTLHGERAPHEWRFLDGPGGKPQLAEDHGGDTSLSFNLAHTNGLVACAVTRGRAVGIDVETRERPLDPIALAKRFFSPLEILEFEHGAAAALQERFVELWVLKEAFVKGTGLGLSAPLDQFAFVFQGASSIHFHPPVDSAASWRFALFAPSPYHRLAIATDDQGDLECPTALEGWPGDSGTNELPPMRSSFAQRLPQENRARAAS
jgi:4'-phosphopantetheinyl transferase